MVRATRGGEFEDSPMEHGYGARDWREDLALEIAHAHPKPMEQSKMTKADDVPEWAWKRACDDAGVSYDEFRRDCYNSRFVACLSALARYIAAREPAPVDPLREVLDQAGDECGFHISEDFVEACRTRGVTVAKERDQ